MICRHCEVGNYLPGEWAFLSGSDPDGILGLADAWHDDCEGNGCECSHKESMHPYFGFTKHRLPVHLSVLDYHKAETEYARFNKKVALSITKYIGTMTCFWIFCLLALCSLPAVLSGFTVFAGDFPRWMIAASDIALVSWVAQTFIQLVLLPALMVGQSLQNMAADARAAKSFEDVEAVKADLIAVLDLLDTKTQGGLREILDAVNIRGSSAVLDKPRT